MASTIRLDSDLYSEQFEDNFEKVQQNCDAIRNICAGKNKLSPLILLGYIWVTLSSWGCAGTYQQTRPIPTTMKMLHRLLKNKNIDLKEVRRLLKIEYELSDEIIDDEIIDELSNPDVTLEELTKTLVDMKKRCPFPEKVLFGAETATSRQDRKRKGDYCVYELKLTGAFKNIVNTDERDILTNNGIISDEILNEAMSTIDEVVKKKLKPETLRKARFLDTKSNALHGYEVYNLLQKPCDNELRNVLHVNKGLMNEERGDQTPLTHWKNLSLRSNAYERIMSKVNLTYLTFCQVLRIALLITSMDINNVTENSIVNDIYKLDPKTAKIDDIDTILKRHDINTRKQDNQEHTETEGISMISLYDTVWHGMVAGVSRIKCFACDGNHYLSQCKNETAKETLRRTKPDIYKKFIMRTGPNRKQIPCHHKDKCRRHREGTCPYKHDSTALSHKAEQRNTPTLSHKAEHRNIIDDSDDFGMTAIYNDSMLFIPPTNAIDDFTEKLVTQQPCKWTKGMEYLALPFIAYESTTIGRKILDSGANIHMTGNEQSLSNKEAIQLNVQTANGRIQCTQKGETTLNLGTRQGRKRAIQLKDVVHNPQLDGDLVSVYQICKESQIPQAIIFTQYGAWTCPARILQAHTNQLEPIARATTKGAYICTTPNSIMQQTTEGHTADTTCSFVGSSDVVQENEALTWHQRLGHIGVTALHQMQTNRWLHDISPQHMKTFVNNTCLCKGCLLSAQRNHKHPAKTPITRNSTRPIDAGAEIHGDLFTIPKECGYTICALFIDSATSNKFVYFTNGKKETDLYPIIEHVLTTIKSDGFTPRKLFYDGEKAITGSRITQLLTAHGVQHSLTSDSQQNLAETTIPKLRRMANHMLHDRNMGNEFYRDAIRYASQLMSILPHTRLGGRCPYQEYYRKHPSDFVKRIRTFGSICYYHKKAVTTKKHDPTTELIFLGFKEIGGPYRSLNPKTQGSTHIFSWHAIFDESYKRNDWLEKIKTDRLLPLPQFVPAVHGQTIPVPATPQIDKEPSDIADKPSPTITSDSTHSEAKHEMQTNSTRNLNVRPTSDGVINQEIINAQNKSQPNRPPKPRTPSASRVSTRSTKGKRKPTWSPSFDAGLKYNQEPATFWSEAMTSSTTNTHMIRHETLLNPHYPKEWDIPIPKTITQAKKSKYWPEWQSAIEIENTNLDTHSTFKYEDYKNQQKLGTRYVFAVKHDNEGNVVKFKARLVAKGYEQIYLQHYDQTFAPVAYLSSILMILVIAVTFSLTLLTLDFKGAFLHSLMPNDYPVYIDTPYGMHCPPGKVIRLHKSLYGTKNAGHLWWKDMRALLISEGFLQNPHDQCVFYRRNENGTTIIATWVDDLLICSNDPSIRQLQRKFEEKQFQISSFDKLAWFLGISIQTNEDGSITLDQSAYIDHLLHKFDMIDAHPCDTPITTAALNQEGVSPTIDTKKIPYRSLVGGLSHLGRFTRADILFATFYFARYQNSPTQAHWKQLKRVLRYLNKTKDMKIIINRPTGEPTLKLEAFCDADWATTSDDYKSTSGYVIQLNGTNVSCASRKQKLKTAQSSCESELYAAGLCTMEILWTRNFLKAMYPIDLPPTPLNCDNKAVIDNVNGNSNCRRLKHTMIKLNLLRDHNGSAIQIQKVTSEKNIADIFTKVLSRGPFERLRDMLFSPTIEH